MPTASIPLPLCNRSIRSEHRDPEPEVLPHVPKIQGIGFRALQPHWDEDFSPEGSPAPRISRLTTTVAKVRAFRKTHRNLELVAK